MTTNTTTTDSNDIGIRIQVHTAEAERLLQSHPLVMEFHHHIQEIGRLTTRLNHHHSAEEQ